MTRADRCSFTLTANRLTKKKLPVLPVLGLQRIGGRHMNYDTDYSTNFSAHFRDYIRRVEHYDHVQYEKARELAGKGQEIPFEVIDAKERRYESRNRSRFSWSFTVIFKKRPVQFLRNENYQLRPLLAVYRRLWPVRRQTFLNVMSEGSVEIPESGRPLPKAISQVM